MKKEKSLREKVEKGLKVAFQNLVEEKKKKNEELVISENGEIKVIDPKDIKV